LEGLQVKSLWKQIKGGKKKEIVERLKKRVKRNPSWPSLMDLGLAHLVGNDLHEACCVFDQLIEKEPQFSANFEYKGLCHWLMNNRKESVGAWQKGLKCQYTDAAGGMQIPLLLFFASVRHPPTFDQQKAEHLIKKILTKDWADDWPAPLGKYLLEMIDYQQLVECGKEYDYVRTKDLRVVFYHGVMALKKDDVVEFKYRMQECSKITGLDCEYEYLLACHEANAKL
jgi:hypothetical protein